jgi:hypothetical protein
MEMTENRAVEKEAGKEVVKTEQAPLMKTEILKTEPVNETLKAEAPKAEARAKAKKEADPSKELVDGIMAEMALKGASKKRLIKTLIEQYGMDKHRVMFKLKRALITERYAAAHAEAGH